MGWSATLQTQGAGLGTLSWACTPGGYSSETQADSGFFGFPWGSRVPVTLVGVVRNRRSPGKTALFSRGEVPLGTASPAAQRVPSRVRKQRVPRLQPSPSPAPLTRLGCGAPLRAPQCPLQLRLQLRSHSGSGSRSDATALGLGWGVPPLRLGLLCVQGRGAPAGPGRTDPRPRFRGEPRPTVSRALPCPALQQQQPRPGRPRAAARATVTLSGPPRRRRGSRVSARRRHGPGHC